MIRRATPFVSAKIVAGFRGGMILASLALGLGSSPSSAAPVTGWQLIFDGDGDASFTSGTAATAAPEMSDAHRTSPAANFPAVTLADGDSLTLTGTVSFSVALPSGQFRFGLFDGDNPVIAGQGDEYSGFFVEAPTTSSQPIWINDNDPGQVHPFVTSGTAVNVGAMSSPGVIPAAATPLSFSLTLSRNGSTIDLEASITDGGAYTSSGNVTGLAPHPGFTFDSVAFLVGGAFAEPMTASYSNIDVTFVPGGPDTTPPLLSSTSPADEAPGVPIDTALVATFNETVAAGTGFITLKNSASNLTVASFDVATSPDIVFNGAEVSMTLPGDLEPSTAYHVLIDATAIVDGSGNPFAGISSPTAWNFTTAESSVPANPGPRLFGIEFNRNDSFGSPSQSLFRIVAGSATQGANAASYTKTIGGRQVTISQPGAVNFEFRGGNGDSTRAIPGGDISMSFLVADFIATREGAIDLEIPGLAAGDYVFRSYHLDTFTGSGLGYAQGSTTTTPNTIQARIGGVVRDSVQPTALGPSGLGTTFIDDSQVPALEFAFSHDGASPLVIELRATASNGTDSFLLLNGFELFEAAP